MLERILAHALALAVAEVRDELKSRRKQGSKPAGEQGANLPPAVCGECGRAGKRECPKCSRKLCGRCACPCRKNSAILQSLPSTSTAAPAQTSVSQATQVRPPRAFSVNHVVGAGHIVQCEWHAGAGCWTYLLRWSNGAQAWMLESALLRYTKLPGGKTP